MSCGSPTAFTGLWLHGHLAGSAQAVTHLPAMGSAAFQCQAIAVAGFISQHTAPCPAPCHHNFLGKAPIPGMCLCYPNTTARKGAGRLWDVTAGQLLASCSHVHGAECTRRDILGTPPEAVHACTHILRGAGGACSTVPEFGVCQRDPMED